MEGIGVAASVISILGLLAQTSKAVARIHRRYVDGPEELATIKRQLQIIESEIELIGVVYNGSIDEELLLPDKVRTLVLRALNNVDINLRDVLRVCAGAESRFRGTSGRLAWSIKGESYVRRALGRLQGTESSLGVILQLLQIFMGSTSRKSPILAGKENPVTAELLLNKSKIQQGTENQPLPLVAHSGIGLPTNWRKDYRLEFALWKVSGGHHSFYRCFIQLPLLHMTKEKALKADAAFRLGSPWYENIHLLCGHIRISNVIPTTSETVKACVEGNVVLLRELFRQRRASPNDVTDESRPLLWYAASASSVEVARFLLLEGADARALTGIYNAELLSRAFYHRRIEMSRLLLKYGADFNHISAVGFTPLFHLYNPGSVESVRPEFLEMLISRGFANINVQSIEGWTALHRAAAHGTAEDVRHLLFHHADVSLRTGKLLWPPIFCAVRCGNVETLEELASAEPQGISNLADIRGWTLLHLAVNHGNFQVIPFLLKAGLDPLALSIADTKFVDLELRGRRLTPGDLAKYHGLEMLMKYHETLQKFGLETVVDDEGDLFWPT